MKHRWIKLITNNAEPDKHKCKICGCIRTTYRFGLTSYSYVRSGIVFGSDRPDCIDWKKEDKKGID